MGELEFDFGGFVDDDVDFGCCVDRQSCRLSALRGQQSGNQVEQSRFACAVASELPVDASGCDVERKDVEQEKSEKFAKKISPSPSV